MTSKTIQPVSSFQASLQLPGSKSLTNRAFMLAALAQGESTIRDPLWADDTRRMYQALLDLGIRMSGKVGSNVVAIKGEHGFSRRDVATLDLGNAGTAMRMLTAACCLGIGRYRLDGDPRMRQRPIAQLVEPLRSLGGRIRYDSTEGCPPLIIEGSGLRGGALRMTPTLSSQYITALLMVAPYCEQGLTLEFEGPITSRPYVQMTLELMAHFGVRAEVDPQFSRIHVPAGSYQAADYQVEPDASNASYFLAAAAILPDSKCTICNLGKSSLQGDVGFADVLHQMGAGLVFGSDFITILSPPASQRLRGIDIDLNAMPDMAQTLAVTALFATGETVIRNVGNLRVKETDRLAALRNELTKLGAGVAIDGDDITITPPARLTPPPQGIDTYHDHRMAMSFALAGLRTPGVMINDPGCVDKTFPDFFTHWDKLAPSKP